MGGGTADLRRNSERFLRISSREVTLEGLEVEREGLGKMGVRGCCWGREIVDCWFLRLALTSLKYEEKGDSDVEEFDWSSWSFGSTGFEEVVEKRWMRDRFGRVRRLGISCSAIKRGEGGAELGRGFWY